MLFIMLECDKYIFFSMTWQIIVCINLQLLIERKISESITEKLLFCRKANGMLFEFEQSTFDKIVDKERGSLCETSPLRNAVTV